MNPEEGVHIEPITLYGSDISYFTGKLENYFKVKGLAYELRSISFPEEARRIEKDLGVYQMPVLQLADGRWMTDSTKIIQWFEEAVPENPVVPANPLQAFVCYLLEDYADEWLWRPAMHFRWHYPEGAHFASRHLADEHMADMPGPAFIKRWNLRRRQRGGYTTGDGVTPDNLAGVEAIFYRTLEQLQAIFERRPFLLGARPSLADIGFSGPFFRHFALDPVPLEIIRQRAPAVLEWVARLWNTRLANCPGDWTDGLPGDLGPLLDEIGRHYLPYLCANVEAVAAGKTLFDAEIGGIAYRKARYSRYRVWCLKELRSRFESLTEPVADEAGELLERHGCWEPLWRQADLPLLPGQEEGLPFRATTKMVGVNEKI